MRVLITGALGNLGRPTVLELLAAGHEVRAFELDSKRNRRKARALPSVRWFFGDIRDRAALREAVRGVEAVIHDAAILPPAVERLRELGRSVNVGGTEALLDAMRAEGVPGPIVLASSVSTYGKRFCRSGVIDAESPVEATDAYSEDKIAAEALVRSSGLPFVILKIGVALDASGGVQDLTQLRMVFEVDPEVRVEVIHGHDVALAQARAVAVPQAIGKTLLIAGGSSCQIQYRDLFRAMSSVMQLGDLPPSAFGAGEFYTGYMDTAESQALLDYQRHSFEEILAEIESKYALAMPPLRVLRPLTRRWVLSLSGPYRGDPPKKTWADFIA
jgi:nucleoside-diphosphate-sugar epimerase